MAIDYWTETVDWSTPAGIALKKLIAQLPRDREFLLTIFGSAPIQITIEPTLLSSDVDLFCDEEDLNQYVRQAGLAQGEKDFYIQVCSGLNFRTSPRWIERARVVEIENCSVRIPHAIDILIAKLNRLDEKDVEAFRVVLRKTGHPTERELIHELQMAVDLFRPSFDEEQGHDMANNCRRLWPIIYGREIDPRVEIIAPALQKRREGYGEPTRDYKQELRDAIREEGI